MASCHCKGRWTQQLCTVRQNWIYWGKQKSRDSGGGWGSHHWPACQGRELGAGPLVPTTIIVGGLVSSQEVLQPLPGGWECQHAPSRTAHLGPLGHRQRSSSRGEGCTLPLSVYLSCTRDATWTALGAAVRIVDMGFIEAGRAREGKSSRRGGEQSALWRLGLAHPSSSRWPKPREAWQRRML